MVHFSFFKRDEIKEAKRKKEEPIPIFGITVDSETSIKHYVRKFELFDDWIWLQN